MTREYMLAPIASIAEPIVLPDGVAIETIDDAQLSDVAGLMARAYAGTTDDEGGSAEDALAELQAAAAGAYGNPLRAAWLLARVDGAPASAVLCTRWRGRPFVAFAFTDHPFTRRGLATALMRRAAAVLQEAGERDLSLVVTVANPARDLYLGLGFTSAEVPPALEVVPA